MPSFSVKWSVKVLSVKLTKVREMVIKMQLVGSVKVLSVKLTKVREMVIKMQLVGTIWNQDE